MELVVTERVSLEEGLTRFVLLLPLLLLLELFSRGDTVMLLIPGWDGWSRRGG